MNQLINNPDGFTEFKDRKVGTIANSGTEHFLTEHFFRNINTFASANLGLVALEKGKIKAFLYDEPILKYAIQTDSTLTKWNCYR